MQINNRVLVIGSMFVDALIEIPELPTAGEDVSATLVESQVGGNPYDVAKMLRLIGISTDLFVPIGIGPHAKIIQRQLQKDHFEEMIRCTTMDNGWDTTLVDHRGIQTFIRVQGVESQWQQSWFDRLNPGKYQYLFLSGSDLVDEMSALMIIEKLGALHCRVLFDASAQINEISQRVLNELFKLPVILHCTQVQLEFFSLLGEELRETTHRLSQKLNNPVVVTFGDAGAYYADGHHGGVIPAMTSKVTNGLGSNAVYCAAMIAGLIRNESIYQVLVEASRISSRQMKQPRVHV